MKVDSIISSLLRCAQDTPSKTMFVFVGDDGQDRESVTAGDLVNSADRIAHALRELGVRPGDRIVLVYPPSLEFIRAFTGCLAAGAVPVPVCPPDPMRPATMNALQNIIDDCSPALGLTDKLYHQYLSADRQRRWERTDLELDSGTGPDDWHFPAHPDVVALLQYTSGSTGAPRGVMISHGNLVTETRSNADALGAEQGIRAVGWVPHFHDLGLISFIVSTLVGTCTDPTYLMSPLTFLRRPATWFDVMDRVRATHTAAPDFGYALAVRKTTPHQRTGWDLSSLRIAMSAGEPVQVATITDFVDSFSVSAFRPEAFYPAYGLAESTVSVSMGGGTQLQLDTDQLQLGHAVPAPAGKGLTYIGSGRITKPGARVRIVDPRTRIPCSDSDIGEIWVDSPTNALGYYNRPDETRDSFQATTDDPADGRRYLRTGDLGFFRDGQLYVTARYKDLIIIRGHNIYPQDIENTAAAAHPDVRTGGVAAFGVPSQGDEEGLALFLEVSTEMPRAGAAEDVVTAVMSAIQRAHGILCHAAVIGGKGLVHKTTSGKVRRSACRQTYLDHALPPNSVEVTTREFVPGPKNIWKSALS